MPIAALNRKYFCLATSTLGHTEICRLVEGVRVRGSRQPCRRCIPPNTLTPISTLKDKNTIIFVFDQSSCHHALSEDALNAKTMNVKWEISHVWGTLCGLEGHRKWWIDKVFLRAWRKFRRRGINTSSSVGDDMRTILSNHEDFQTEKTIVEHFLDKEGLESIFLPKFHCELNPIERVWGQAKTYTWVHTNFTFVRLRNIVDPGLDSVSVDLIRKYCRRVREYEEAYLEGKKAGRELEKAVKVYKSHRRIFDDNPESLNAWIFITASWLWKFFAIFLCLFSSLSSHKNFRVWCTTILAWANQHFRCVHKKWEIGHWWCQAL